MHGKPARCTTAEWSMGLHPSIVWRRTVPENSGQDQKVVTINVSEEERVTTSRSRRRDVMPIGNWNFRLCSTTSLLQFPPFFTCPHRPHTTSGSGQRWHAGLLAASWRPGSAGAAARSARCRPAASAGQQPPYVTSVRTVRAAGLSRPAASRPIDRSRLTKRPGSRYAAPDRPVTPEDVASLARCGRVRQRLQATVTR